MLARAMGRLLSRIFFVQAPTLESAMPRYARQRHRPLGG